MSRATSHSAPAGRDERPDAPSYLPILLYILGFGVAAEVGIGVHFGVTAIISNEVHWLKAAILPITAGIVCAIVVFIGWHTVFKSAAYAETTGERLAAAGAGFGVMMATIVLSGWFWATLLGGSTGIAAHRAAFLDDLQKTSVVIRSNCQLDGDVVGALRQGAVNLRQAAVLERGGGDVSGDGSGNGPATKQIVGLSNAFDTRATESENIVAGCNTALNDLRGLMDSMRKANDPIVFERLAMAATDLLAKASSTKVSTAGLSIGTISEKITGFAREALQGVESVVSRVDAQRVIVDEVPAFRPLKPAEAVTEYAPRVLAAWLIPISFEVVPFMCLLLLLAQPRRQKPDVRVAADEHEHTNVVEFAPAPQRPTITPAE